jgi:ribose transport system ATP-binding protein/rhamnose transport system ATP-binding protein
MSATEGKNSQENVSRLLGGYLAAEKVSKSFGGVPALDQAAIYLKRGEIHALVGANGAGKSTLARIIAGHLVPDQADIRIDGKKTSVQTPRDAINLGVAMVTQQLSLAGHLSVAENIMLSELGKPGRLRRREILLRAGELLEALNPSGGINLNRETRFLSPAHRQMVEIAKAMSQNPQVMIFDEPTTSLTPFETERLFSIMEELARQGKALAFVSHRLEEIFAVCHLATVLRDGRNAAISVPIKELDQAKLIQLIIGRDLGGDIYRGGETANRPRAVYFKKAMADGAGEVVLEAKNLCSPPKVVDVSFKLRKGEILGLAGLVGSGRSETARAIFGRDRLKGGEIILRGQPYSHKSPHESYRRRLAMIPEDRRTQSSIPDFTVRENIMIGRSAVFSRLGTGYSGMLSSTLDIMRELRLHPDNLRKFILELSGGMQQKAILSRSLLIDPEILILDEPTQGVDVGARSDIYAILRRLAARGIAMLFISSDFEEVLGICDRIVILSEGRSVADFAAGIMDEEKMTMFAAPRASAKSTYKLLEKLIERWPGAGAHWVYFDQGLVYCFESLVSAGHPDTGFRAGEVVKQAATCLAPFLPDGKAAGKLFTSDRGLLGQVAPILNARGQHLGYIGLTLPGESAGKAPSPEEFMQAVTAWK